MGSLHFLLYGTKDTIFSMFGTKDGDNYNGKWGILCLGMLFSTLKTIYIGEEYFSVYGLGVTPENLYSGC